ncbi:metallo-peptidase, Clan MC, Family M14 [Trypanosoma conorhini]|uniref:Metallo-peptidase, Clan MC, Family M14 n=1 Tax=Trypanosoma conorhini TaxID=83891 RepID=A0A422Q1D3_9TRYP|nr:metallo-peptidase, Clan MC, Family M14 [Trypanosoma conorhini]RNF23783.1 metallo-peptidase, Clan MC, Family M14 [Trypanosoma conorhini]
MPVKVGKGSAAKGARGARKTPETMDVFASFTSQLAVMQDHGGGAVNGTPQKVRNASNNKQNGNHPSGGAMRSTPRFFRSPALPEKRNESHCALPTAGECRRSIGLLRRLLFKKAPEDARTPVERSSLSEPSYDLASTTLEEATTATATATAAATTANSTSEKERNNNATVGLLEQDEVENVPPPQQLPNSEASMELDANQLASHNIPSECSSLNSSIAQTPNAATEKLNVEKALQETTDPQQPKGENGGLCTFNLNEAEPFTVYDEEDEEEAVHQYLEKRQTASDAWGDEKREAFTLDSMVDLTSKTSLGAESVSTGRHCSARRKRHLPWRLLSGQPVMTAKSRDITNHHRSISRGSQEYISDAVCRSMSLYSAFFLDDAKKTWRVDDLVLARSLEYVGLMGYQQLMPVQDQASQDAPSAMIMGKLASPITRATNELQGGVGDMPSTRWVLTGAPCRRAETTGASNLFMHPREPERWISEQEYVLGAIFSSCAWSDRHSSFSATNNSNTDGRLGPHLSLDWHPIQQVAAFVLERFPHWGGAEEFVETWERQVGIVLGTASPSHQRVFNFPEEGLVFSSDMESGNLARVERTKSATYQQSYTLWLEPELGCAQRLWFRFAISGARPHCAISLRVVNIQPNTKLYARNGMRPVWRAGNSPRSWTPVGACVYRTINNDEDGELSFVILPRSSDVVHVAFCVPYTYADLLCHIVNWHHLVKKSFGGIRFEERVLCHTQDGRKLHLLIITSTTVKALITRNGQREKEGNSLSRQTILGPYAHFETGKKVVLVSGRVHPGEVTASHGIHGVISFLLSRDPHAALVREYFIFYIVPMLNPDGVARGHSRLDQNGFNLNRCYNNPNPRVQPTVTALRNVFENLKQTYRDRFFMYMDFHSHASQSSGFMFGNCLPETVQHWNMVFPKIVSLHAKNVFSYQLCRFGRGHMVSKEGSSRVLFGEGLIHSYTVELTHFSSDRMFVDGASDEENNISDRNRATASASGDGDMWEANYANTQETRLRSATAVRGEKGAAPQSTTARSRLTRGWKPRPSRPGGSKQCVENGGPRSRSGDRNSSERHDPLRCIQVPCILSQSAEVGRACVLALLDYCAVGNYASPQFAASGGLERTLREVKRSMNQTFTPRPAANRLQLFYKQR